MNKELLRKLQLQAGGSHYPDINPQMQEKFAELIIRECAGVALREEHDPYECILNHFGVEK